jgi:leader peptidase (prepilin peptidase)/N-methyltransferase
MVVAIYILWVFIVGVIVGSFFNVLLYRYRTGKGVGGRSRCLSCGHQLKPIELIPFVSFILQKGKCAKCKTKLSYQYPLVELCSGLILVMVFGRLHFPLVVTVPIFLQILIDVCFWWLLLLIAVYDIRHKIIPNFWVFLLTLVSLLHVWLAYFTVLPGSLGNVMYPIMPEWTMLIAGPLVAIPLAILWLVSGGRWIGLGDAKLMLPLGWYFGVGKGLSIFVFSFWIGAIPSIILLCLPRKRFTRKN